MGQYYIGVNVDKKQYISPHKYDSGAKLLEWGYIDNNLLGNDFTSALHHLMEKEWNGDRVYIVGDYADLGKNCEADENWLPTLKALYDEFEELGATDEDGYETSLYKYASDNFKHIDVRGNNLEPFSRFAFNKNTKEYIDLKYLPVEWDYDEDGKNVRVSIDPLALMITMGNERGGGDYHRGLPSFDEVGRWTASSQDIFFGDEEIDGYTKFMPNFSERK